MSAAKGKSMGAGGGGKFLARGLISDKGRGKYMLYFMDLTFGVLPALRWQHVTFPSQRAAQSRVMDAPKSPVRSTEIKAMLTGEPLKWP